MLGSRELVFYFVEEMGVPVNTAPACNSPNATEAERFLLLGLTLLVGAVLYGREELALELLALRGQGDLDFERRFERSGIGGTLLMHAAELNAARVVRELLVHHGVDLDA